MDINTPENLGDFVGQFVVFFSDADKPEVLFSSFTAEEAYKFAHELKEKEGKEPIVFQVNNPSVSNIAQLLSVRI